VITLCETNCSAAPVGIGILKEVERNVELLQAEFPSKTIQRVLVVHGQPSLRLSQPGYIVPNPFAGTTTIHYALAEACPVEMRIFDAAGRQVRSLRGGSEKEGLRSMVWDGRDDSGAQAGSGTYYLRFVTPRRTWTRPIVLLR
jgi:hypothetical protein